MNNIKKLWEERSRKYGRDVRGVLPKSFPAWLNQILHRWMSSKVKSQISNLKSQQILDLGCGYGRVAREVLKDFSKAKVYGVDLSRTYVNIFNKDLSPKGHAVVGDIRKLPFKSGYFDLVFMITTLMYITTKKEQELAMKEIFRVIAPSGRFVFIERNPGGHSLFTLGGLITKIRGKKHKEIRSVSFEKRDMESLTKGAGAKMDQKTGFPFGPLLTPSLYIAYSGHKP